MTNLQQVACPTQQLSVQDKAFKEKYGNRAHITPTSNGTKNPERYLDRDTVNFGKLQENSKEKKAKNKALIAGALLAAGAAIAVLVATKGKKVPPKTQVNSGANSIENKIKNYLAEIRKKPDNGARFSSEPIVTKLKNGGFKYEFSNPNSANMTDTLIFDKAGNFNKYISFARDGKRVTGYSVYNKPTPSSDFLIKEMSVRNMPPQNNYIKFNEKIKIMTRGKDGSFSDKQIIKCGNEKVTLMYKPPCDKVSEIFVFKDKAGKPSITAYCVNTPGRPFQDYILKPGEVPKRADKSGHLTETQIGDLFEAQFGDRDYFKNLKR